MAKLSIQIDDNLKRDAEKEFRELGLSLSAAVNIYFEQVRKVHGVPFVLKNNINDEQAASEFGRKISREALNNVW
jgi:DNA-damage-inducible protein J